VAESKQTGLELIALTANGGLSRRAQTRPGGVWGEWRTLGEVSPFDTTFAGEATVTIPELNVSEQKAIALGIRFSFDRRIVQITSFPALETKRFDTPIGSNKTTVTMTGAGIGTFEAASGRFAIPIALKFDQSVNVAMVQEDAAVKLELSTEAEGGSVLDRATAHVALGASGKFTGSGSINPLRNKAVTMLISGKLDPLPVKRVAAKK
jgi:hypothetical protein